MKELTIPNPFNLTQQIPLTFEFDPKNLLRSFLAISERRIIESVLSQTKWNQVQASNLLGINRNTLRKKMKGYGLMQPWKSEFTEENIIDFKSYLKESV